MRQLTPFWYGLVHGLVAFLVFATPLFLTSFPKVANLTIGGLVVLIVNWLEQKKSS